MIYGKRIRLRLPETESDHLLMVKWRNDPQIKPAFYNDDPVSLQSHMEWWEQVRHDPTQRNFMVEAIDTEPFTVIGMTALMNINPIFRTAEYARFKIGMEYQGRGYATETEPLFMRYAFDCLNINKVWLHAFTDNATILKLHEKTGFIIEGTLRQHVYKGGCYRDVVTMALFAEDFRAKHD